MDIVMADGCRATVSAFIDSPQGLGEITEYGVDRIGLLDPGFLVRAVSAQHQEEKVLEFLLSAAGACGGRPVTVLLPDMAGDAGARGGAASGLYRGIRPLLSDPGNFRPFLRAVLRAGAVSPFELALSMVSQPREMSLCREILSGIREELAAEGLPCVMPASGMVVEVPSVVPLAANFTFESGFFIVGSNFLRYLMADDRLSDGDEDLALYYGQAFLAQIQMLVDNLKGRRDCVRISAPLVRDPSAVPLLLGLGIGEIIAPPELVPGIKQIAEMVKYRDARLIASKAVSYWIPQQAREYVLERINKLLPATPTKKIETGKR
ncbi:MAG: putative PEP-binding protein [Bacillota bacterium]